MSIKGTVTISLDDYETMKQGLIVLRRLKNQEYQMRIVRRVQDFLVERTAHPALSEIEWRAMLCKELDRTFELICRNDSAL